MNKSRKELIANFIRENVFNYTFTSTLKVAKDNPEILFCSDIKETKETIEIIFDAFPHNKIKSEWSFFITDGEDEKVYLDDTDKTLTLDDGKEYFIIESCCAHEEYASYHYMIEKEKIDKILFDCKYAEKFSIEAIKIKLCTKKLIKVKLFTKKLIEECEGNILLEDFYFLPYKIKEKVLDYFLYHMNEHSDETLCKENFIKIINEIKNAYYISLLNLVEIYYLNGTYSFFELIDKVGYEELNKKIYKLFK